MWEFPWLRLAAVWACLCVAAGIIPGQAVFLQLFAGAGVFAAECENAGPSPCDEQVLALNKVLTFIYTSIVFTCIYYLP